MAFADPGLCPACRGRLDGSTRCPSCGLDLTSPELVEAWRALQHADQLIERVVAQQRQPVAAAPPDMPPPNVPPGAPPVQGFPSYPAPGPAPHPAQPGATPRPASSWSVGTVLLTLGAFGLVVAALIFVSRSWDTLGLPGKAAIMLAATVGAAAAALWVTRRPLRASAEALWAVFLALVATDLFAARGEGMLGLDGVSWPWTAVGVGLILTAVSAVVLTTSRGPVGHELWVPGIGALIGLTIASAGASGVWDDGTVFWHLFVGLVVAGVLGLSLRVTDSRRIAIGARIIVAVFLVSAAAAALGELFAHPSAHELTGEAHGLPMLMTIAAMIGIGVAIASARVAMTALAFLGVVALFAVPATEAWAPEGGFLVLSGAAALPAIAALRGQNDWLRGLRAGVLAVVAGLLCIAVWWLGGLLYVLGRVIDDPWQAEGSRRIIASDLSETAWWPTAVVAAALLIVAVVLPRWPEARHNGGLRVPLVVGAVLLGAVGVVVVARPAWWVAVAVFLSIGLAAALLQRLRPGTGKAPAAAWGIGAIVAIGVASALALGAQATSVAAWLGGGLVLAAVGSVRGSAPAPTSIPAWPSALFVAPLLAAGGAAATDLAGAEHTGTMYAVVLIGLVVLAGCALTPGRPEAWAAGEAGAAITVVVGLIGTGDGGRAALAWTIAGVTCCVVAALRQERRDYLGAGVIALLVAYVLVVVDSSFNVVEAYTLPIGIALLAAGLGWMRRRPTTGTWTALGAGLAVSLLPSLPQALADPTGLRALLLGAAAVAVLGVGAWRDWQAPFVMGSSVAALVLLFNIGPYANAAPRVVVIAVVSAALVAIGVTWEDRVRDGRRIVAFVKAMR